MDPERPGAGFALWRRWADSGPWSAPSAGLLPRRLVQSGRPPSFCFLLPRVHAADVAPAQPAQMPSPASTSTSPAPAPTPAPSYLPNNMGSLETPETGWDRIKDLFRKDPTHKYSEELLDVIKSGFIGALAGLIYGGVPAAIHAKRRYIQLSQAEVYTSRVDAVRSGHNAAIRGFVRYGVRWSWRVAVFVTLFNSVGTGLSVYRDKTTISNYIAAGAVTGGLFRLNLGLKGLVAGAVIGAALGLPTGAFIVSVNGLIGETARERRKRERKELYELRLAEWSARLQLTEQFVEDLNVGSQAEDSRRIQELLSLPKNEDAAPESSSQ